MQRRSLVATDFADALALYQTLNTTPSASDGPDGSRAFADLLAHQGTQIIGAEVGGHIVSMATLHILPNMTYAGRPYALVENVVTAAAHQGRGLGTALMQHVLQSAWDAGCYKVMLLTGQAYGARGFYEKLGFSADDKVGMTLRRAPVRTP